MMIIYKQFSFDSAHFLPNVPENHKCRAIHGHTYHLTIYAEGRLMPHEGWVFDFGDLKKIMTPVIDTLDHHLLNEIPGLENPLQSYWQCGYGLKKIELKETPTSGVIYEGE